MKFYARKRKEPGFIEKIIGSGLVPHIENRIE
jgi:hypothetical protein